MTTRRQLMLGVAALLVARPVFSQVIAGEMDKIVNNSFSHRLAESVAFRYSFGEDDLRWIARQSETVLIVHHGKAVTIDGYIAIHQHLEGLPIFTSKSASVEQLPVAQVKELVSGKWQNWKEVGGADLPVKIAARQDGVWGRALSHMISQNGIEFPNGAIFASSYEQLAEIGLKNPGTVLLGLRDAPARWEGLTEMEVDKAKISASVDKYPIANQITVFLKERNRQAVDLGRELSRSLSIQAEADQQITAVAPSIAKMNAILDAQDAR